MPHQLGIDETARCLLAVKTTIKPGFRFTDSLGYQCIVMTAPDESYRFQALDVDAGMEMTYRPASIPCTIDGTPIWGEWTQVRA